MLIIRLAGPLFAASLTGCSAEMAGASGIPADNPVPVTITLAPEKMETASPTKAGNTPVTAPKITDDGKINTLDIYIIDNEGKVEKHVTESDFTSPGSDDGKATTSSPVELLPGTKTVYAFANCRGNNFSGLGLADGSTGWTAVPEAVSNNAAFNVIPEITTSNDIPMSASTTWEVTEATETTETPQATYPIELVRMAAQMQITIKDERDDKANTNNKITSLTLSGFLSDQTNLFRKASGEIQLPGASSSLSDWKWERPSDNTNDPSIAPFYLHETTGTFPVSMQIDGETSPRTTTLNTTIPRNRIYPLTIHLTDYSLKIEGTYHLAAIGTVVVSKNIGNGYTIELPEGSSDIEIKIQLKEGKETKTSGVTWSCESLPACFTSNTGDNATLILLSNAIPATVMAAQTVTVTASFTKGGSEQTRPFDLTIKTRSLTDDDITPAKAVPGHLFGVPQTISIEL